MAKKRAGKKRAAKPARRSAQMGRIFAGVALVVMIVLGAGILARLWLDRPPGPVGGIQHKAVPPAPPVKTVKPAAPGPAEPPPVFEHFPPKTPPTPKAPAPLPQLQAERPVVAIIVDDMGYDRHLADRFMSLAVPLTLSVLPIAPASRSILNQAQVRGFEVMLHLPMEPDEFPGVDPGPGALFSRMGPDELIAQLEADLDLVSGIKGVNNHMGSRISTSSEQMRQIFSILKKRGLYYIDSRTSGESVAQGSARLLQLPFAERDIFIDHVDDPEFIRSQLRRLVQRARKQGYAIGIAHPHENTFKILKELLPELLEQVDLVPASMVVQQVTQAQADRNGRAQN